MAVHSYKDLLFHVGHHIVCAAYGDPIRPDNVAIECMSCNLVLRDYDRGTNDWGREDDVCVMCGSPMTRWRDEGGAFLRCIDLTCSYEYGVEEDES